ncbi:hypothetical protein SAMN04487961_0974 [Marinobacter pelagius]|uniref:Uncharacterized protein n=1 Tax=Marinobacter pelagius TaxID=379482 RepID=A0A1I4T3I7_9GAMM|nr:hypothetical protein SAMN04487961_0974 [Marinobacter pelagius]
MEMRFLKAAITLLNYYFDSVAEVDRKLVLTFLKGLVSRFDR